MKIVNGKILDRLLRVAMISLIIVAAVAVMGLPTVKALPLDSMYVDPSYQEIQVCTNFTVKVSLTTTTYAAPSAGFNLTFDPSLLECVNVTLGSLLPPVSAPVILIDNASGWVLVSIFAQASFSGPVTIADITFHCKGEGTSFLNFSSASFGTDPTIPRFNGTCNQVSTKQLVGGEVLAIDALPLLIPWIAAAGAVAAATVLVLANRRTINR
jgi:hypothetical protein